MERLEVSGAGSAFHDDRSIDRIRRDVGDEIAFHLAKKIEALEREGFSLDEAREEALLQFGDVATARARLIADDQRGERRSVRFMLLDGLVRDIRFACRALARTPGFTLHSRMLAPASIFGIRTGVRA